MERHELIEVARGKAPADVLLRGGHLVNVLTGEIYRADVAMVGSFIAGIGAGYEAREVVDVDGALLMPGFLDTHVHIESSMCVPSQFARIVVPHGTTTAIVDAHEIANVAGLAGLAFMLEDSAELPLDVYMMAPSCVPASPFETPGAILGVAALSEFVAERRVLGMGEMMNYPGVLAGEAEIMAKLELGGGLIDGHAPDLTGQDLCAYVASGIGTDHECRTAQEALEKLRLGMRVMIREGSLARNLIDLLPAVGAISQEQCMFATDDRHADDLVRHGHLDHAVRQAIAHGLDPILAVKLASLNGARAFRLERVGAIAPGWQADLLVVDGFERLAIRQVYKRGKLVAREGVALFDPPMAPTRAMGQTVRVAPLASDALEIRADGKDRARVRVIGVVPGQCWSHLLEAELPVVAGEVLGDPAQDVVKLAVIERHHATGNVGKGFAQGFGLRRGAIASTVAHDAHNLVVLGCNDADMFLAIQTLVGSQGGLCATLDGRVIAHLPLPIAGLMSDRPMADVAARVEDLEEIAARELGFEVDHPFMTLAFLALSVIPELKITDLGYVDVTRFERVEILI